MADPEDAARTEREDYERRMQYDADLIRRGLVPGERVPVYREVRRG